MKRLFSTLTILLLLTLSAWGDDTRKSGMNLGMSPSPSGGGVSYRLNDSFSTDVAAGSVNGTAAVPGPGTRTVLADSHTPKYLSISGGNLAYGGRVNDSDPGIRITPPSTTGNLWLQKLTIPGGPTDFYFFGEINATTTALIYQWVAGAIYLTTGALSTQVSTYQSAPTGSTHICSFSLGAAKAYAFRNGYLLYAIPYSVGSIANTDLLVGNPGAYPFNVDYVRIPYLLWTPKPISADSFGGTWPTTDGGGLTGLEAGGNGLTWGGFLSGTGTTGAGVTWDHEWNFAGNLNDNPGAGKTAVNLTKAAGTTTYTTDWANKSNEAASFDGSTIFSATSGSDIGNLGGTYSILIEVDVPNVTSWNFISSVGDLNVDWAWGVVTRDIGGVNGCLTLYTNDGTTGVQTSYPYALVPGTHNQIILSVASNQCAMYLNGVCILVPTAIKQPKDGSALSFFGGGSTTGPSQNGTKISRIATLKGTALTAAQVKAEYEKWVATSDANVYARMYGGPNPTVSPGTFTIQDEFTDSTPNASMNGSSTVPTGYKRFTSNSGGSSTPSSSGGWLTLGPGYNSDGTPGLWECAADGASAAIPSPIQGQMVIIKIRGDGNPLWVGAGWDVDKGSHLSNASLFIENNIPKWTSGGTPFPALANGEDVWIAVGVSASSEVSHHFIKSSVTYPHWTFLGCFQAPAYTGLWPAVNKETYTTYLNTCYVDYLRVPTTGYLAAPIVNDGFGTAFGTTDGAGGFCPSSGVGSGGGSVTWATDNANNPGTWAISSNRAKSATNTGGIALATVPTGLNNYQVMCTLFRAYDNMGLVVRHTDINNYVRVVYNSATNAIDVIQTASGTPSTLSSTPTTYSAGTPLMVDCSGATIRVYYNSQFVSTNTTTLLTGGNAGIYNENTSGSNTIDNFTVYARGNGGEYDSALNAFTVETNGLTNQAGLVPEGVWGLENAGEFSYQAYALRYSTTAGNPGSFDNSTNLLRRTGTWSIAGGKAVNAPVAGAELVIDGDMEAVGVTNWSNYNTPTTKEKNTTAPINGARDLHIITDAQFEGATQIVTWTAGVWYRLSGKVKVNSGNAAIFFRDTTNAVIGLDAMSGSSVTSTGRCLNSGAGNIYLSNWGGSAASDFNVDDISAKPLPLNQLITAINHTGTPDVYASVNPTIATGFQAGLALNIDDPNNPTNFNLVYYNQNDAKVYAERCVNGVYANIFASSSQTYSANKPLVARRIGEGSNNLYVWYNNVYVGVGTATPNGTWHGMFQTGASSAETNLDDWFCYGSGTNGEYNILNAFTN